MTRIGFAYNQKPEVSIEVESSTGFEVESSFSRSNANRGGTAVDVKGAAAEPRADDIYAEWDSQLRRVYTDGRSFPDYIFPSFNGYSIGEWRDEDDDGVYDALFIETRGLTSPRMFDWTGAPLHENGETVVLEEIRLREAGLLENTITTIDDALTKDWTIRQRYERNQGQVVWTGHVCVEEPRYFELGGYWYQLDPKTYAIEPANEDQPPLVSTE